jgi:anti-sigma factor RsiW
VSMHLTDDVLSASLDGDLAAAEEAAVTAHVAGCAGCRQRLDLLRATAHAVAGLPDEPGPVSLDFSFLAARPAAGRILTPAPGRWRPPVWAVPAVAAAAVLVVAVSYGPSLLGQHPSTASSTSAGLAGQGAPSAADRDGPLFDRPAAGAAGSTTSGQGAANFAAGPSAPKAETAPLAGSASRAFSQAGGLTLTLAPAPGRATAGQPINLTLEGRAGQAVALRGFSIDVQGPGGAATIGQTSAVSLAAGQRAGLMMTWSAGQVTGAAAPGDYQLTGHATLTNGTDLSVTLTIHVT